MTQLKRFLMFVPFLVLTACSSGQDTFYWYRPQTGINYFAKDHNACLYQSDNWPYEWPNMDFPPSPETFDLKLRSVAEDGIWAYYVALPGSQPVYVNSKVQGQWSMSGNEYAECMRELGYEDVFDPVKNERIGVKYCYANGCVDASSLQSGNTQDDKYGQRRYLGEGPYTSHYYGHDSKYYHEREFGDRKF